MTDQAVNVVLLPSFNSTGQPETLAEFNRRSLVPPATAVPLQIVAHPPLNAAASTPVTASARTPTAANKSPTRTGAPPAARARRVVRRWRRMQLCWTNVAGYSDTTAAGWVTDQFASFRETPAARPTK